MYSVQSILRPVHCTVYTVQWTATVHWTLSVQATVHCSLSPLTGPRSHRPVLYIHLFYCYLFFNVNYTCTLYPPILLYFGLNYLLYMSSKSTSSTVLYFQYLLYLSSISSSSTVLYYHYLLYMSSTSPYYTSLYSSVYALKFLYIHLFYFTLISQIYSICTLHPNILFYSIIH